MNALSSRILQNQKNEAGDPLLVTLLQGWITCAAHITEAIAMQRDVIELYIESLIAHGEV